MTNEFRFPTSFGHGKSAYTLVDSNGYGCNEAELVIPGYGKGRLVRCRFNFTELYGCGDTTSNGFRDAKGGGYPKDIEVKHG